MFAWLTKWVQCEHFVCLDRGWTAEVLWPTLYLHAESTKCLIDRSDCVSSCDWSSSSESNRIVRDHKLLQSSCSSHLHFDKWEQVHMGVSNASRWRCGRPSSWRVITCLANSRGLARQIEIDTEALNPTHRKRFIDGHFQLWTQFISLQTRDWHPNFQNLQVASLQGTILSVEPKFGSQDPKHHRICIEASLKWTLEDQMPQCMQHMQKQTLQTLDSILTWGGLK